MFEEQLSNEKIPEIPKSSKKKILIPVFILIILLFGGLFTILAARIWDPLWNPFRPKPETVIKRIFLAMEKVKTSEQKMEFSILAEGEKENKTEIKLTIEGKKDKSQVEKSKFEGKFDILISVPEMSEGFALKINLGGETKIIGEKSYLKITTIPDIPFLEMFGINLSGIKNQWIKIDDESIIDLMQEMSGSNNALETKEMWKKQSQKNKENQKWLEEKLKEVLSKNKFYIVKKQLADEKIGEKECYHYLVALDKKEVSKMMPELLNILEEMSLKTSEFSPSFEKKEIENDLNKFIEKVGEIEGEIWIGKKDYFLYKIEGKKSINLDIFEESKEKGNVLIVLKIENSGFNKPFKIEEPSNAKGIKEIFTSIFGELGEVFGEAQKSAKDAQIITNLTMIRTFAETMYSNKGSYKNLCSNSSLNEKEVNYGKDLKRIKEDIKTAQGGFLKISCFSSANSYCITANLSSPEKGKYCIDSSGFSKEVEENSKCLGKGTSTDPYRCPVKKSNTLLLPSGSKKFPF